MWGIDCYTRRMIEIAIEDRVDMKKHPYTPQDVRGYLERVLKPAINRQPYATAHNMTLVTQDILKSYEEQQNDAATATATATGVLSPSVQKRCETGIASYLAVLL